MAGYGSNRNILVHKYARNDDDDDGRNERHRFRLNFCLAHLVRVRRLPRAEFNYFFLSVPAEFREIWMAFLIQYIDLDKTAPEMVSWRQTSFEKATEKVNI